jgi:hypothetical protein
LPGLVEAALSEWIDISDDILLVDMAGLYARAMRKTLLD